MLIVIFTYNREEMLKNLLGELKGSKHDVLIIDDGTGFDWRDIENACLNDGRFDLIELEHGGKRFFWRSWKIALDHFKHSKQEYVCFLPDDVVNLQLDKMESFTKQGWDNMRFAINLSNPGNRYRWGHYSTGQPDFKVDGRLLQECGYVDGCFITNRHTLQDVEIDPIPASWFDRESKSSGVGHQMTYKLRKLRVKMMIPETSYLYHGDHESVMHKEHRKQTPLISK